jgi:hypothetical protein
MPGDFWSVPLDDGRFACGRVLKKFPVGIPGARVAFWGGLQEWVGTQPPNEAVISDTGIIDAGKLHILSITTTGGDIAGNVPLTSLETIACCCVSCGTHVLDPFDFVRVATDEDRKQLIPCGAWGYSFIKLRAQNLFGRSEA